MLLLSKTGARIKHNFVFKLQERKIFYFEAFESLFKIIKKVLWFTAFSREVRKGGGGRLLNVQIIRACGKNIYLKLFLKGRLWAYFLVTPKTRSDENC